MNGATLGAARSASGATRLNGGASALAEGLGLATDGATTLADGAGRVADGASTLNDGAVEAGAGARALDGGLRQLSTGADRLSSGLAQLSAGPGRPSAALSSGASAIPAYDAATRADHAQNRALVCDDHPVLVGTFGSVGKFLGITFLMLQVTSAAGTFPIETAPAFFRAIHPLLPMTHVIVGLRQAISGGDLAALGRATIAVAAYGLLGFVLTMVTVHRNRQWRMERLHPVLEI